MIGRSKMNERSPTMTPYMMVLDVSVLPKRINKINKQNNIHLILIRLIAVYSSC